MSLSLQEAKQFVNQFIREEYTPAEHAAFLQWLKEASAEELNVIAEMHESRHEEWVLPEGPSAGWMMQLEQKLNEGEETVMDDRELVIDDQQPYDQQPVIMIRPRRMRRWNILVVAAAIVVLLLTGMFIHVQQIGSKQGGMADREKLLSMTFVNPMGGAQKELILSDGSKVWLNAGSVLKYPQQFTGSERLVELSGEAFFEVTGNSGRPFRVLIRDAEVEVLGTFFAIMAYDNEPENRTSVVSGAVKITSGGQSVTLNPGQQAEITYSSPGVGAGVPVVSAIDPKLVLAWKDGIYRFKNTELSTIMREVARAYDVKVEIQPSIGDPQIDGALDLNKNVDINLKLLETIVRPNIKFNYNGKIVTASPI
jgi:ferric-dicitrate binding protein FerR (iron transport regulator)